MCDYNTPTEKRTGRIDCPRIGVDSTGAIHYWDEPGDRVLVIRDGDVADVQQLDGRPLAEYREFVADERGWELSGGDLLGNAIATVAGGR